MGNAYTAVANDVDAVYWNPAGMLFARPVELGSMQVSFPTGYNIFTLNGLKQKYEFSDERPVSAWGIYWVNGAIGDLPLVSANSTITSNTDVKASDYFDSQDHAIGISYARWLSDRWAAGLTTTGIYREFSKVAGGKGGALTLSPGLLYLYDYNLVFGLVLRDIVNVQKWGTGTTETILPEARLGVSWTPWTPLLVSAELRQKLDRRYAMTTNLGSELTLFNFLKLRAGLDDTRLTAGCGIYARHVHINYAFVGNITDGLGDTHRVGLGLAF